MKLHTTFAIAALLPLLAGSAELPDLGEPMPAQYRLTSTELAREVSFIGLLLLDYGQTRSINGFCAGRIGCTIHETNPLLGEYPSDARIRNYFVGGALLHVLALHLMPTEYRAVFQNTSIAIEAFVVSRNAYLGLRVKF